MPNKKNPLKNLQQTPKHQVTFTIDQQDNLHVNCLEHMTLGDVADIVTKVSASLQEQANIISKMPGNDKLDETSLHKKISNTKISDLT